jgi:sugar/nucleoside kinase (ribokinase family)
VSSGILAGGNWIRDHVKTIDAWPTEDGLANILKHEEGHGGGPYNVLKNLSRLGAAFPLAGVGLLGDDADGRAILADCAASRIDPSLLKTVPGLRTSHTDVMTVQGSGRRTFFHDRGANAGLGAQHFQFGERTDRLFYLGYLMLLDGLDRRGADGLPLARDVLRRARSAGMRTAIDCVSSASADFRPTVSDVLPEADILFANDFEAEQVCAVSLGRGPALSRAAAESAARALVSLGVREWAVVHFPEGVCACDAGGRIIWQPSVKVAPREVRGSAGAGDALAAGILLGVHEEWPMERSLELGACAAACSLLDPTCSKGVLPVAGCLDFGRSRGFSSFSWAH